MAHIDGQAHWNKFQDRFTAGHRCRRPGRYVSEAQIHRLPVGNLSEVKVRPEVTQSW